MRRSIPRGVQPRKESQHQPLYDVGLPEGAKYRNFRTLSCWTLARATRICPNTLLGPDTNVLLNLTEVFARVAPDIRYGKFSSPQLTLHQLKLSGDPTDAKCIL